MSRKRKRPRKKKQTSLGQELIKGLKECIQTERAERKRTKSLLRKYNCLFWIGLVLILIPTSPFQTIGLAAWGLYILLGWIDLVKGHL